MYGDIAQQPTRDLSPRTLIFVGDKCPPDRASGFLAVKTTERGGSNERYVPVALPLAMLQFSQAAVFQRRLFSHAHDPLDPRPGDHRSRLVTFSCRRLPSIPTSLSTRSESIPPFCADCDSDVDTLASSLVLQPLGIGVS